MTVGDAPNATAEPVTRDADPASAPDPAFFHRLYGRRRTRITYQARDFLDYVLMISMAIGVLLLCYAPVWPLAVAGIVLAVYMVLAFPVRHGIELRVPILFRRPQDVLFLFVYKIQNIKAPYWIALAVLLAENVFIALTPTWPHHSEWFRSFGYFLFFAHLLGITAYRTVILVAHLRRAPHVREVLLQSVWKRALERQPSIRLEIFHAYFTGLLTHLLLIAPWFFVLRFAEFSVLAVLVVLPINGWVQFRMLRDINAWYYRDHWLGHNSELEFVYLHGSHHDAIPSGLIGVAGNGFLEGVTRQTLAYPTPFFNPIAACLFYTLEIQRDIYFHQYIPGVYPSIDVELVRAGQHSTHHFGRLEPYGFGINLELDDVPESIRKASAFLPESLTSSYRLDHELTGFEWDNPRHRWYLALLEKYQR